MTGTRPLAIGVLRVEPALLPAEVRRARVAMALLAHLEGYVLVETFEFRDSLQDARDVLGAVEELAVDLDADALLVRGLSGCDLVDEMAERLRLLVRAVPDGSQPLKGVAPSQTRSKLAR